LSLLTRLIQCYSWCQLGSFTSDRFDRGTKSWNKKPSSAELVTEGKGKKGKAMAGAGVKKIGQYALGETLGTGSFGKVKREFLASQSTSRLLWLFVGKWVIMSWAKCGGVWCGVALCGWFQRVTVWVCAQ
jgi:hypothetical protein